MSTTVTFVDDRIGRRRGVEPLVVDSAEPLEILAAVERYARRFLGSRGVDSDYFPDGEYGLVFAGYRPVARFTVAIQP